MLWLGLLLLTIGAIAAIVVPLLRGRQAPAPPRAAFDRAVYRDQLGEIARDLERGTLEADQATAARLEIERRLLATDEPEEEAVTRVPVLGITAVALAAAVAAGAMTVYLALGSPQLRDEPLAARRDDGASPHAPGDLASSVDALAARLKEAPNDARGWLLLARSQASLQRWQDSAASYQRAMTLTDAPEASAGFGEMLVMAADGLVTPAARSAFTTALARDPGNAPARFYLALGDAQDGKASEAIAAWGKLADEAPPDAPWLPLVRQRMAEAARAAGIALLPQAAGQAPPPSAGGTPSAADIEAVQAMSPAERQAMIRGMVERLAARLDANPDDAEGWQRLARAYAVLGETEKAEEAAARAAALAKR
ncbi:MAG TPA: c-type cytochrome biogenesis protein CcmI [Stellaceae bacterium]|jgi:cytochrome c-type biogenesis protein CcmH|nr:c-type cytochrome biogenesis protein CcmI [Stellaceae bacterium]